MKNVSLPQTAHVVSVCIEALSHLPRLPYTEWITVLSGLANEFGEENALHIATHAGFKDERRNETAYKIRKCLKNVSFGSVVFLLRQYGIDTTSLTAIPQHHCTLRIAPPRRLNTPPPIQHESCIGRFIGADAENAEERAGIYQFDGGMSRYEAEKRVAEEFPHLHCERLYRCAVSIHAMNKNVSCSWTQFMETFQNTALSSDTLQAMISEGYAIAPFLMNGRKSQANWIGAELCFIDVDGTMTLEEALQMELTHHCLFLYTSPSHTEAEHRFRLVFALPYFERKIEAYREVLQKLIAAYRADTSCSDPSKFYFGNTCAWMWQPSAQVVNKGRNGVL